MFWLIIVLIVIAALLHFIWVALEKIAIELMRINGQIEARTHATPETSYPRYSRR